MTHRTLLTPFSLDRPVPGLNGLTADDWQVNRPDLPDDTQEARMSIIHRGLADWVAETAAAGDAPVSVAGDCCTTIGVLAGLQRAGVHPTLVWFDAHGDFNTWETTPSGFLGGMPLAMLVGLGDQSMVQAVGMETLPAERVILTDARDLDPGERELVANSALHHLPDVQTLLSTDLPHGPLWVHFDVDVISPDDVPAVSYPAPGGPSAAELGRVFRRLRGTGRIVALSVSTWNPDLDTDGRSRAVCMALLAELTGEDDER